MSDKDQDQKPLPEHPDPVVNPDSDEPAPAAANEEQQDDPPTDPPPPGGNNPGNKPPNP